MLPGFHRHAGLDRRRRGPQLSLRSVPPALCRQPEEGRPRRVARRAGYPGRGQSLLHRRVRRFCRYLQARQHRCARLRPAHQEPPAPVRPGKRRRRPGPRQLHRLRQDRDRQEPHLVPLPRRFRRAGPPTSHLSGVLHGEQRRPVPDRRGHRARQQPARSGRLRRGPN